MAELKGKDAETGEANPEGYQPSLLEPQDAEYPDGEDFNDDDEEETEEPEF